MTVVAQNAEMREYRGTSLRESNTSEEFGLRK